MKNIYLFLSITAMVSCSSTETEKTTTNANIQGEKTEIQKTESILNLESDASFEGSIFGCMRDALKQDGIDLLADMQTFHSLLVELDWLKNGSGKDYYDFLQKENDFEPGFEFVPVEAAVFGLYAASANKMSDCKIGLVSERNEAYLSSTMFKLDNLQSGYKSDGSSIYLQLLEIYKNELSAKDLDQPYYKFSVQYILYMYWSQKVHILPGKLPQRNGQDSLKNESLSK